MYPPFFLQPGAACSHGRRVSSQWLCFWSWWPSLLWSTGSGVRRKCKYGSPRGCFGLGLAASARVTSSCLHPRARAVNTMIAARREEQRLPVLVSLSSSRCPGLRSPLLTAKCKHIPSVPAAPCAGAPPNRALRCYCKEDGRAAASWLVYMGMHLGGLA